MFFALRGADAAHRPRRARHCADAFDHHRRAAAAWRHPPGSGGFARQGPAAPGGSAGMAADRGGGADSLSRRRRSRRRRSRRARGAAGAQERRLSPGWSTPCCAIWRAGARSFWRSPKAANSTRRPGWRSAGAKPMATRRRRKSSPCRCWSRRSTSHGQIRPGRLGAAARWRRAADGFGAAVEPTPDRELRRLRRGRMVGAGRRPPLCRRACFARGPTSASSTCARRPAARPRNSRSPAPM